MSRRSNGFGTLALVLALTVATAAFAAVPKSGGAKPAAATKGNAATDSLRVLVRVGKEAITTGMVQKRINELPEQYRAQYSSPSGRQQILDRLVEEKVWMASAVKHGVADRPAVKQQLEQQRRDLIIRAWINEQMALNPAPSDSDARVYYDAHLGDYRSPATLTVRAILSATESEAKRVAPFARDNRQDFGKLAEKYSSDTLSKKSGGMLGTITRDGVFPSLGSQPALAESLFALPEGKVGGPYSTSKGWVVAKVEQKRAETVRPFEQTRPLILRQLSGQRSQDFYKQMLERTRKEIGVSADSAAIKGFVSARKSARDMFKEAQEVTNGPGRLEAYQRVLDAWPDSDVAPQAQFMVGFIQSEEMKSYDEAEKSFHTLLKRYPKSELVPSAQWMIDHMRSEEAPAFITQQADSVATPGPAAAPARKPEKRGKP